MPQPEGYPIFEFKAEVKEVQEDGTFTGVASIYGVEDLQGDVIDKGAFKKTLSDSPQVPILWQHMRDEVIGNGRVKEWQNKVLVEAKLDIEDDPTALKAYRKLKKGLIKGLSIGFKTVLFQMEQAENRAIRHITELRLFEISVVTFPALPGAQVTRVKSTEEIEMRIQLLETDNQALRAAIATLQGAGTQGKGAALEQPTQPADVHSWWSTTNSHGDMNAS